MHFVFITQNIIKNNIKYGIHNILKNKNSFILFSLNGGDPLSLQLILGHTTLTMTQKYVHFVAEMRLVEQMKYSPLSKKD